jgi:2-amino-4-hydroxy-6-hydroxymethyldihydropteridine diphosphokinase
VHSHAICLAMGTNMGDRAENLRRALVELGGCFEVIAVSPIYETEPAYHLDQSRFLNQCCLARTGLSSQNTLAQLKHSESALGRAPGARFGPRLIDLDLLFYDDLVLTSPGLTVPHPLLHERAFVLVPLNDIAPEIVHPALGVSVRELYECLSDGEKRKVWAVGGAPGTGV